MKTTKKMRLSRIKITKEFAATIPTAVNMESKYAYYRMSGTLFPITLDSNRVLVDGYCSYLLAKMFGIKKVDVITNKKKM